MIEDTKEFENFCVEQLREEIDEYCRLFPIRQQEEKEIRLLYKEMMLKAGYKPNEFTITVKRKENKQWD